MIRTLGFLVVVGLLVAAAVWVVDSPGAVSLDWRGYRLETSFAVLLAATAVIASVAALLYRLWLALKRAPTRVGDAWRSRRRQQGYQALTRGMVAVSAGEADEARRQVKRAEALLDDPPLTMLLSAQAAQLNGDEKAAERFFEAMTERPETEFLGVRGLMNQAVRQGDTAAALSLARRAYRLRPKSDAVASRLFDLQISNGQWLDARVTGDELAKRKMIDGAPARRRRAVLAYQMSREAAAGGDLAAAEKELKAAVGLEPALVPAVCDWAALLCDRDRHRKAVAVLEKAWAAFPHPDLVEPYWRAAQADDGLARVKAAENLAAIAPDHPETHLAVAEAALEAQLWGEARGHLDALSGGDGETEARVCRMMARLVESEHDDPVATRDWLVRASVAQSDPAWVCETCGNSVREWTAVCGNCEAFDGFSWRRPAHVVGLPETEGGTILPVSENPSG